MTFDEFKVSSGDIESYRPINPIIEENSSIEFDDPTPTPTPTPKPTPLPKANKRQHGFTPPSLEDVAKYCRERGNRVDAERFVDYYAAIGWRVGKNPMRDWQACVRTWERKEEAQQNAAPQTSTTDAIKARREREQAATVRADDLVEFPAGSGEYHTRSEVEAWTR